MMINPFPPELRTMSFVNRWAILMAHRRDNIAEHSYFVTVYANIIADLIKWKGPLAYLMWLALIHDTDETVTGDIISPSKSNIIDPEKYKEFLDEMAELRMPGILDISDKMYTNDMDHDEAARIVHCADKLDAVLYLIGEKRMGNSVVDRVIARLMPETEGAWRNLPADPDLLSATWQTVVVPSIKAHYTEGGKGLCHG